MILEFTKSHLKLFRRATLSTLVVVLAFTGSGLAASFNPSLIMDDTVFGDVNSMNPTQINSFLNQFAYSCISPNSGFQARIPSGYSPSSGYSYGGYATAGEVIYDAARVYGVNPQVLIVTLEKEQSLVTGRNSTSYCQPSNDNNHKYAAAVGYGCPDSGSRYSYTGLDLYRRSGVTQTSVGPTCVNSSTKAGFSQQIIRAAWLLKFGQQRSKGNTAWNVQLDNFPVTGSHWDNSDDPLSCYGGPMTQGNLKRCSTGNAAPFDGYATIDGAQVHMDTGATASFYWYTPHRSGNLNFFNIFTGWFGGTISADYYACHDSSNVSGAPSGQNLIAYGQGKKRSQLFTLSLLNNTGSECAEFHTWNNGLQSWAEQVATNMPAVNPSDSTVVSADTNNDGIDEFFLVRYRGTGSGMIEIHGWDNTKQHWVSHVATNMPAVDPSIYHIITADNNGDGKDEFYLVKFSGTGSGKLEVHGWSPGFQSWASHVATNYPSVTDPANFEIIAGDTVGNGKDQFYLVKLNNTGSGKLEVHGWNPGFQSWASHVATNYPSVTDPANFEIMISDNNGDAKDEFYLVRFSGTGSGKLEVHGWNPGFQSWASHVATNKSQF